VKLVIGFDADTIGEYRIRDGKIKVAARTDNMRAELKRRLEGYARQMAEVRENTDNITAEDLLRFIVGRAQGRNWTELVEGD
jgi:hypothetical protein